ncbi:hypothetical protein COO60DRAFT_805426 [Scenedesmus sp. NREL 46B-D3]|nr:hypothetical protein COO60DRAFT_805426 [Scenedesmus sp. NREL 46B-D3]
MSSVAPASLQWVVRVACMSSSSHWLSCGGLGGLPVYCMLVPCRLTCKSAAPFDMQCCVLLHQCLRASATTHRKETCATAVAPAHVYCRLALAAAAVPADTPCTAWHVTSSSGTQQRSRVTRPSCNAAAAFHACHEQQQSFAFMRGVGGLPVTPLQGYTAC